MKNILSLIIIAQAICFPRLLYAQASGIHNGELNEYCAQYNQYDSTPQSACAVPFQCVYGWHPVNGVPYFTPGELHMSAIRSDFYDPGLVKNNSVMGYYIWEPGSYVIELGFKFDQTDAAGVDCGFDVYAISNMGPVNASANWVTCRHPSPDLVNGDWDYDLIGSYIVTGDAISNNYTTVQMQYTYNRPTLELRELWINPYIYSATPNIYGGGKSIKIDLDYVRIRKCGSGSISIQNTVTSGQYLKENIEAGLNTQTNSTSPTTMVGQFITLSPGFSSTPTATGTFDAVSVSTCDLPVQDEWISGKPGRQRDADSTRESLDITALGHKYATNSNGVKIFPNPASDVLNVTLQEPKTGLVAFVITDIYGRIVFTNSLNILSHGSQNHSLNISKLSSGTYILKVSSESGMFEHRFVINR